MKTIGELPVWFLKQKRSSKLLIGGLGLILLFGLCGLLSVMFTRFTQQSPSQIATYQGANNVAYVTWTPAITDTASPTATPTGPVATRTPLPTGLPTQSFETATLVILPTNFSAFNRSALVVITAVDKELEYVDIQNIGAAPVNLRGWTLVSETGNQSCPLRGILQTREVLRIWAGMGPIGISCEFKNYIWLDEEPDPAVLYNAQGEEVSRYPRP